MNTTTKNKTKQTKNTSLIDDPLDSSISSSDTLDEEPEDADVEPDMADLESIDDSPDAEADVANLIALYEASDKALDPVTQYLREIGTIPLLSKEDEQILGKQISDLKDAIAERDEILEKPKLTKKDEKRLEKLKVTISECTIAKNKLCESNLKLVVSIAKRYNFRSLSEFLDIIQEGNLGLIKASEKFDYTRGFKFSTYATWWIRQSITRSMAETGRLIRLPVHISEDINRIKRAKRNILAKTNKEATIEDIAAEVNLPIDKVKDLIRLEQEPMSLNMTVGEDNDSTVGDFIPDDTLQTPEEKMAEQNIHDVLFDVFKQAKLSDKEIDIICRRNGIDRPDKQTLEEIGKDYNITRERVRQIEAKVVKKLRHPKYAKILKELLEP